LVPPIPLDFGPGFGQLWGYSSSYQLVPCAWSADRSSPEGGTTVNQYVNDHNLFYRGSLPIGDRRIHEITFPAQKVGVYEYISRHTGKVPSFYAYADSVVPMMFWDGSASSRVTGNANKGCDPNSPYSVFPQAYYYNPSILGFEPPTRSGATADQ